METVSIFYIFGQILGAVTVVLGFISYQMKTSKKVLIFQISVCATFSLHYLLIGGWTGFFLNVACLIRNIAFYFKGHGILKSRVVLVFFTALMPVLGIFSWQGWPSVFVIIGMMVNTVGMSFRDPQNMRRSILISSPLVILYDVLVASYGGIVYESVVIVSSIVGIAVSSAKKRKSLVTATEKEEQRDEQFQKKA